MFTSRASAACTPRQSLDMSVWRRKSRMRRGHTPEVKPQKGGQMLGVTTKLNKRVATMFHGWPSHWEQ